jgi:hypothetical protein
MAAVSSTIQTLLPQLSISMAAFKIRLFQTTSLFSMAVEFFPAPAKFYFSEPIYLTITQLASAAASILMEALLWWLMKLL